MIAPLPEAELEKLEAAVDHALRTGEELDLEVLGYGEISCVVAWTTEAGRVAAKRLPVFSGQEAFAAYARCVEDYLEALHGAGIVPLETLVQGLPREDGRVVGYCLQPALPRETLVTQRIASGDEPSALDILEAVTESIRGAVSDRLGLDGQVSNWVLVDGELRYLDVSTPLLRDEAGRERLDTDLFLASLPWGLRGLLRWRFLHDILDKYYDSRGTLVDLLGNFHKEGWTHLVLPLIDRIERNAAHPRPITGEEVARYYASDARMWELLQRLRRLDRAWQRRVRRRTYPFLLPGRIERHV